MQFNGYTVLFSAKIAATVFSLKIELEEKTEGASCAVSPKIQLVN